MAEEGHCMKCKASKEMKDTEEVTMKNGRKAMKGVCTQCGTKMFKILGTGAAKPAEEPKPAEEEKPAEEVKE